MIKLWRYVEKVSTYRSGLQANASRIKSNTLANKGERLGILVIYTLVMTKR